MSRITKSIKRITDELSKVANGNDIVADKIEELERQVVKLVSEILDKPNEWSVIKKVLAKETFQINLVNGYSACFEEGNTYNMVKLCDTYYVEDIYKQRIPFTENIFDESFTIVK